MSSDAMREFLEVVEAEVRSRADSDRIRNGIPGASSDGSNSFRYQTYGAVWPAD